MKEGGGGGQRPMSFGTANAAASVNTVAAAAAINRGRNSG